MTELAEGQVEVDRSLCASTGVCESKVPEVFEIADDGEMVVLQNPVPAELLEQARAAAKACPTRALRVG